MARSNFQFVDTDTDTIVARMIRKYETIMGRTVQPASFDMLLNRWGADVVVQVRVDINYSANQNIPSRAEDDNLDALGEIFYYLAGTRPQAKVAATRIRFNISEAQPTPWLIPASTRVATSDKAVYFATVKDVYVTPGEMYAEAEAVCDTPGIIGNGYMPGQVSDLVDIFPLYVDCANITMTDGGSDAATDEEYYELMRLSEDAYSCAGASGAYVYYAMSVSPEIADVKVTAPTPGVINIFTLMDDGSIASDEIKNQILARCDAYNVRPLTDLVLARDPVIAEYDIELIYYTIPPPITKDSNEDEAQSAAAIAAAVDKAVEEYKAWQSAKIGRDINPSRLMQLLMATGIKRADIISPVFTRLKGGSDEDVPEVAKIGTVTVTDGGYEDE